MRTTPYERILWSMRYEKTAQAPVTLEMWKQLLTQAEREDRSIAYIIRQAIARYLKETS